MTTASCFRARHFGTLYLLSDMTDEPGEQQLCPRCGLVSDYMGLSKISQDGHRYAFEAIQMLEDVKMYYAGTSKL
jgi:hypothetical protein